MEWVAVAELKIFASVLMYMYIYTSTLPTDA